MADTSERPGGAEAVKIALEHAVRRWEAETRNAERLAHRENGILALVAAVLGLGLFKFSDLKESPPPVASWGLRDPCSRGASYSWGGAS